MPNNASDNPLRDLLLKLKEQKGYSVAEICQMANQRFGARALSQKNVGKWFSPNEAPKYVRDWCALLMVLAMLEADSDTTNNALGLSKFASLEELKAATDEEQEILGYWLNSSNEFSTIPSVTTLPIGSRLEIHPNPLFTGREKEMLAIKTMLDESRIVVIAGLGGVGKTQLSIEYAHRWGQDYEGGVFWVSCSDTSTIDNEIAACGGRLGMNLPNFDNLPIQDRVAEVKMAWREQTPRLLILDNVQALEGGGTAAWLLHELVPPTGGTKAIVTSNKLAWSSNQFRILDLGGFAEESSVAFLMEAVAQAGEETGNHPLTREVAGKLARTLNHLPLALHLAASYLKLYCLSITPESYLEQVEGELDLAPFPDVRQLSLPTDHIPSVQRTFAISFERLDTENEIDAEALRLLVHAAYLAPGEPIPVELLLSYTRGFPSRPVDDPLRRLSDLGLMRIGSSYVLLHRMVAMHIRSRTQRPDDLYSAVLPEIERGYKGEGIRWVWMTHLLYLASEIQSKKTMEAAAWCSQFGGYLTTARNVLRGRTFLLWALDIQEEHACRPEEREGLAYTHHRLGINYNGFWELDKSFEHYSKAKKIRQDLLPRSEAEYAKTLHNLGYLAMRYGKLERAEAYLALSRQIKEKLDMPLRVQMNNEAFLCFLQNASNDSVQLAKALHTFQTAQTEEENSYGYLGIAAIYCEERDMELANFYFEQATKLLSKRLPPQHYRNVSTTLRHKTNGIY